MARTKVWKDKFGKIKSIEVTITDYKQWIIVRPIIEDTTLKHLISFDSADKAIEFAEECI